MRGSGETGEEEARNLPLPAAKQVTMEYEQNNISAPATPETRKSDEAQT